MIHALHGLCEPSANYFCFDDVAVFSVRAAAHVHNNFTFLPAILSTAMARRDAVPTFSGLFCSVPPSEVQDSSYDGEPSAAGCSSGGIMTFAAPDSR
jgi:hypothetical protein